MQLRQQPGPTGAHTHTNVVHSLLHYHARYQTSKISTEGIPDNTVLGGTEGGPFTRASDSPTLRVMHHKGAVEQCSLLLVTVTPVLTVPLPASPADCKALVGQDRRQYRHCSPDVSSRVRLANNVEINDLHIQ